MASAILPAQDTAADADRDQVKKMMMDMLRKQFEAICMNTEISQCLSMSESQCKGMTNDWVDQCLEPAFDSEKVDEKKLQQCGERVMQKHGIDNEKAKQCDINKK